ncbi:hypothetical protein DERP_007312 [Dermatophagoides pteronyssinus]|uniref:Uncharacterized protein n=1 Tax=Dermatophagoides pteronyssinus TaxID=6956 RepID=A0ABQ8J4M7_DERPT|nr:hypothetical protein DERP_007312 [Dermatophagoides pteronyssinus]
MSFFSVFKLQINRYRIIRLIYSSLRLIPLPEQDGSSNKQSRFEYFVGSICVKSSVEDLNRTPLRFNNIFISLKRFLSLSFA